MADVYSAVDERLHRRVAVKIFKAGATDQARFERESKVLVGIQDPHVVGVLDAGVHDERPFVVLDLYDYDLTARLDDGPVAPQEAATLGAAVAQGLAAAHAVGVIHRDVKPSNILLSADGHVVLADFGVARLVDQTRQTQTATTIGTPRYLAPEQAAGETVGPPADVYALGLVLLEALTGEAPFPGSHQESLAARLLRSPEIPTAVPDGWQRLLTAMTARDPAERPSAEAAAQALRDLADDVDAEATSAMPLVVEDPTATMAMRPVATPVAPRRAPPQSWLPLAAAIAVGVIMIGAIVLALAQRDPEPAEEAPAVTTLPVTAPTAPPRTTRTAPTTPPTTAPPAPDNAAICAELQEREQANEAEWQAAEQQYADDPAARQQAEAQYEAEQQAIEEAKQQADC